MSKVWFRSQVSKSYYVDCMLANKVNVILLRHGKRSVYSAKSPFTYSIIEFKAGLCWCEILRHSLSPRLWPCKKNLTYGMMTQDLTLCDNSFRLEGDMHLQYVSLCHCESIKAYPHNIFLGKVIVCTNISLTLKVHVTHKYVLFTSLKPFVTSYNKSPCVKSKPFYWVNQCKLPYLNINTTVQCFASIFLQD